MSNIHTYSTSQKDRELELNDKITKSAELNTMLLNLFYTVSHNLSAYTGNIKMLLDIIDSDDDPMENKVALGHLRTVSNDLSKTITDLSQIVYVQNSLDITREVLNLNEYLKKTEDVINGYNPSSNMIFINNVPDDAFVMHNPGYLESILLNFSTNALKYAHPERFPVIKFNYSVEGNNKVLTITDNGLGIDLAKYGNSIFGLNKTFHHHENANGIGLYLTKYQIEVMRGMVGVESKVGEGSTFKILFSE